MSQNEIKAVDLVRKIRDEIAEELAGKSPEEVMKFFNKAREAALAAMRRKALPSQPTKKAN